MKLKPWYHTDRLEIGTYGLDGPGTNSDNTGSFDIIEKGGVNSIGFILVWGHVYKNGPYADHRQIGYKFSSSFRNQGYCTEALRFLLDNELIPVQYRRFIISGRNWRSSNVASKLGFKLVRMDECGQIWEHPSLLRQQHAEIFLKKSLKVLTESLFFEYS